MFTSADAVVVQDKVRMRALLVTRRQVFKLPYHCLDPDTKYNKPYDVVFEQLWKVASDCLLPRRETVQSSRQRPQDTRDRGRTAGVEVRCLRQEP